ncbi:hypothetical protein [Dinghuibacter silviterrae]|uniref:Thiol-disulfide isomerase/thioredoxin n=1 Tax=Dinghuibacter silviterrae TaxID=1539049 RepID=A0A4R8DMK1_9BACT|nr:hypothetical protein [Dinghuibacter silviterrae]TDW99219.1 hypothetical protein EDB95_0228 [Dinghuibacter silviterrae]
MTRLYVFSSLLLLLTACAHTRPATAHFQGDTTIAFHGDTAYDANGQLMLLGEHPRTDLEQKPFARWFDSGYAAYTVDTATTALISPLLKDRTFEIFMGTWCGDSRREVPRMFKILDACGVPRDHIRLITLDYRGRMYKQSPQHEEAGLDIVHVPDLLVKNGTEEQARIVESPVVSLEKDLLSIARGEPYQPQYRAAWWLSHQLRQAGPVDEPALADSIKEKTKDAFELCTLSYVLYLHGDTTNAFLTKRLNAAVFPGNKAAQKWLDTHVIKKG